MFILELMLVVLMGMVGVGDDSLAFGRRGPGHLVLCCFSSTTVPSRVCRVFVVEKTKESSLLLTPASASASASGCIITASLVQG
jgi:hypothetical protein